MDPWLNAIGLAAERASVQIPKELLKSSRFYMSHEEGFNKKLSNRPLVAGRGALRGESVQSGSEVPVSASRWRDDSQPSAD